MGVRRDVLLRVAQFVAKIGSLHLAISGSIYFTAYMTGVSHQNGLKRNDEAQNKAQYFLDFKVFTLAIS